MRGCFFADLVRRELLAEGEILQNQLAARAQGAHEGGKDQDHEPQHGERASWLRDEKINDFGTTGADEVLASDSRDGGERQTVGSLLSQMLPLSASPFAEAARVVLHAKNDLFELALIQAEGLTGWW